MFFFFIFVFLRFFACISDGNCLVLKTQTVLAIQAKKKRYKHPNKGKGRPREKETRDETTSNNHKDSSTNNKSRPNPVNSKKHSERWGNTIEFHNFLSHLHIARYTLLYWTCRHTNLGVLSFRAAGCLFLNLRAVLPIGCEHLKNQQNLVNHSSVCLFVNHYCLSRTAYLLYVMGYTLGDKKTMLLWGPLFF